MLKTVPKVIDGATDCTQTTPDRAWNNPQPRKNHQKISNNEKRII